MQLSKIKMSGFKSFVDPTTVMLPSKLVAVVGPNGCGKSNIIDAITWVMGESSPKYLRGEALTDVIFNGSSARKPIGQASVELIFDNTDGTVGGEYAQFAEISVKRMINRASDSSYYLNGVRCRKRDIVDIFLGTGLGPRSYSIVGQNMISRMIEAKPAELRGYLEEAAGISKYKERRHETELRIQHTKENLTRVIDLTTELEKQLKHLKYQANIAEKYKSLKQQERVLKAEWHAIQWRNLDSLMVNQTLAIQREETALEAKQSELTSSHRDLEHLRHEQRVAQDSFQEVQRRYYAISNEITRIEQDILHHQERQQQWETDLAQTEAEWLSAKNQITESEDELNALSHELSNIEPSWQKLQSELKLCQEELSQAEENAQSWQIRWDEFNQFSAQVAQTVQKEKLQIEHYDQRMVMLQKRKNELQGERAELDTAKIEDEIEALLYQEEEINGQYIQNQEKLTEINNKIHNTEQLKQQAIAQLDQCKQEWQRFHGQIASLEALQQTALGQRDNSVLPWLQKHDLAHQPRLAQHLQVEKGWELAVEKVLGVHLQAICLDDFSQVSSYLDDMTTGKICLFSASNVKSLQHNNTLAKEHSLLSKVSSPWNLDAFIGNVYTANSLSQALELAQSLQAHESVITPQGIWVNRDWLKILQEEDAAAGIFLREQEIKSLQNQIAVLEDRQSELESMCEEHDKTIENKKIEYDLLQQTIQKLQKEEIQITMQHKAKKEQLVSIQVRVERCNKEYEACINELSTIESQLCISRATLDEAQGQLDNQVTMRESYLVEREDSRNLLHHLRIKANQKNEESHAIEIRIQTAKSRQSSINQHVSRLQTQLSHLNDKKITLQSDLTSIPPIETLKKTLSRSLDKHVSVESELNMARIALESLEQEFKNTEHNRQILEQVLNKIKEQLEALRMNWHTWKAKSEAVLEQLAETEFTLEDILKGLPEEADANEWQSKLEQINQRIIRLGPINLVAIDEYATCSERKQYLDQQVEDLQSGLTTLENAIAKIDNETRSKFKETFDLVNNQFQELFPTIFGGGKAYLELTDQNLLEAGISMMACPPGKRNSSIYLLSGGEKSLTAIALIFSIFYLNPAPFCLLDEVDAALDDANVLRFVRLVKKMADKTQFIFISHNKITIEAGEHLIGVTMNEPGVSRLVSVDIEKAMTMVEA